MFFVLSISKNIDWNEKPTETTDLPDDVMDSICEMIDAFRI